MEGQQESPHSGKAHVQSSSPTVIPAEGRLNGGCIYRERIALPAAGMPAIDYLTASRPHSTRAAWGARFADGQIALDGVPAAADAVLRAGQMLTWCRPPWVEPAVPLHFDVLLDDGDLLAVVKPRGLPTMPAGGFLEHTLLTLVRAGYPGANPLHRLGRHTSGLVLFARTPHAAADLSRAWRRHDVTKEYRALAAGVAEADQFAIDMPIGPVPHPRLGHVHAASPSGRPAHSVATVLERRHGTTVFRVGITTGRPHQIRIHLAAAGHPLVGDPLYASGGLPRSDDPGLPGDGGYLLHAECLQFIHPRSRDRITLRAAPPNDLLTRGE
jgi:23S rRNA pseudouridine1911/1915/1917 synthase